MIHVPVLLGLKIAAAVYQSRAAQAQAQAHAQAQAQARAQAQAPDPDPGPRTPGRHVANPVLATAQLFGPLDTAECGGYQLSLYGHNQGTQLLLGGSERGTFDVGHLRVGDEVALYTAAGSATPMVLRRDGLQTYSVCVRKRTPADAAPLQATR